MLLTPKTEVMATQQTADSANDTIQNVADKVKDMTTSDGTQQNLLLDEVTGERVSKTELKRRQKNREKDAKKFDKTDKKPPPQPKRKAVSQDQEESNLNANVSQFITLLSVQWVIETLKNHYLPILSILVLFAEDRKLTWVTSNTSKSAHAQSSA